MAKNQKQPRALRLADAMSVILRGEVNDNIAPYFKAAAVELRRLHDENQRLRKALEDAKAAFGMAFDAAELGAIDEILLHCGHHEAKLAKALDNR